MGTASHPCLLSSTRTSVTERSRTAVVFSSHLTTQADLTLMIPSILQTSPFLPSTAPPSPGSWVLSCLFLLSLRKLRGLFCFNHPFNKLPGTHHVPGNGHLDAEYRVVNEAEIPIREFTFSWVPSSSSFLPGEPEFREPLLIKVLCKNSIYS